MDSGGVTTDNLPSPLGLRVLLVDGDSKRLNKLEKMLQRCDYIVTTCTLLEEALEKYRKDVFDIVMCDANMPGEGSFEFVRGMNLPVLMISDDKEKERNIRHDGACGYLHRPIRMKELRNIWKYVVCEQRQRSRSGSLVENQGNGNGNDVAAEQSEHLNISSNTNKRKEIDDNSDDAEASSKRKKSRVIWTEELHQKFLKALRSIENGKIGPKRILELMNVEGLSRENVASHLQKFRQKQNDQNTAAAAAAEMMPMQMQKHYDYPSVVQCVNSGYQNMINENSKLMQPIIVADKSYGVPRYAYGENVGVIQRQQQLPMARVVAAEKTCSTITTNGPSMSPSTQSYIQFNSQLQTQNGFHHLPLPSTQEAQMLQAQHQLNQLPFPSEYEAQIQAQHQLNHLQFPSESRPVQFTPLSQAENQQHNHLPYPSEAARPIQCKPLVRVQHLSDLLPLPSLRDNQSAPQHSDCGDINPASNANALQSLAAASNQNPSQLTRNDHMIPDQKGEYYSTMEPGPAPDEQSNGGGSLLQNGASAEYKDSIAESDDLTWYFGEDTSNFMDQLLTISGS